MQFLKSKYKLHEQSANLQNKELSYKIKYIYHVQTAWKIITKPYVVRKIYLRNAS